MTRNEGRTNSMTRNEGCTNSMTRNEGCTNSMTRSEGCTNSMTSNEGCTNSRRAVKIYAVLLVIGVSAFLATLFTDTSLCLIYNIAGIPCFSCGMSRAFRVLPDISRSFAYHPLFFVVPFIPLLVFLQNKKRNITAISLIILFVAVWIVRMVLFFPNTPPMVFNESSLFAYIMRH